MVKVCAPTIQDEFKKSIYQNQISNEALSKQADVVRCSVGLGLRQGFPVSMNENNTVQFELGKGHLDNSYISKLPLPLIKTAFALIAQKAGVADEDARNIMIVKQRGLLRDKVIAYIPEAVLQQMTEKPQGSETVPAANNLEPQIN